MVLYNENDAYPAQWLRNLAAAGHIAPGTVDERSIADLKPEDVADYTQAHFFAGIGVWSYALRLAGWPDDRPVWTGSCPCQPFSAAGKRGGTDDPRHLWPEWSRLIRECKPPVVFGEQVASRDGLTWLDIVYADLEGAGYSVGALDTCAAGFGAPHIRQRLYFVAVPECGRREGQDLSIRQSRQVETASIERRSDAGVAESNGRNSSAEGIQRGGQYGQQSQDGGPSLMAISTPSRRSSNAARQERNQQEGARGDGLGSKLRPSIMRCGAIGTMGNADGQGWPLGIRQSCDDGAEGEQTAGQAALKASSTNDFWANAEWLACSDGKARPTQPGIFPLATGHPQRVARLRAIGNCLCAPQAAEFIRAALEIL